MIKFLIFLTRLKRTRVLLVQEFIEGTSLQEEFSQRSIMHEADAIALLQDVLNVLQFVHQNQVIHRDIKPGNLIRRKHDNRIVLIDFGAVKEIQTQITGISGETNLTVGIGTQGYTPSEQLMGKPRYCSDIYALGMTVIQAITGVPPARLPDDDLTLEVQWHDHAAVSPGLTFILDRMVRYDYTQRYQSAADVLQALQRLADLPTDATEIPSQAELSELLLPEALWHTAHTQPAMPQKSWQAATPRGCDCSGDRLDCRGRAIGGSATVGLDRTTGTGGLRSAGAAAISPVARSTVAGGGHYRGRFANAAAGNSFGCIDCRGDRHLATAASPSDWLGSAAGPAPGTRARATAATVCGQ
jgi:serine/threonine protein kinase